MSAADVTGEFGVRTYLRPALGGLLLTAAGPAETAVDTNRTDRPLISAGERDFGHNLFLGVPRPSSRDPRRTMRRPDTPGGGTVR